MAALARGGPRVAWLFFLPACRGLLAAPREPRATLDRSLSSELTEWASLAAEAVGALNGSRQEAVEPGEVQLSGGSGGDPELADPELEGTPAPAVSASLPSLHGVAFQREVLKSEPGLIAEMKFDHGCKDVDEFGSNVCKFADGDVVHATITYRLPREVQRGMLFLTGSLTVEGLGGLVQNMMRRTGHGFVAPLEPVRLECDICGSNCSQKLLGKELSIPLPPCPIPGNQDITFLDQTFEIPSHSLLGFLKGRFVGTLALKRYEDFQEAPILEAKATVKLTKFK